MINKFLALIMVTILVIGSFASYSNENASPTSTPAQSTAPSATPVETVSPDAGSFKLPIVDDRMTLTGFSTIELAPNMQSLDESLPFTEAVNRTNINQCRITLGGNLCGTIIYRETSLPLLLSDATITILGNQGLRTVPFNSVLTHRVQLAPGELIVQLHVPSWALYTRHFHIKRTTNEKIDYPLVSMAALMINDGLRVAFSGICSHPFRNHPMEDILNDRSLSSRKRADIAMKLLPEPAYSDAEGSGKYRSFVFRNMLQSLLEEVEDG